MIFIGIDPGVAGGIASLTEGGHVLTVNKMPDTDKDLLELLDGISTFRDTEGPATAVLERVASSPQMGVVSAFTFGRGYGALQMALAAREIPFDQVTPAKWQQAMSCLSLGIKNITKRRAQQLFPSVKVTHAIADALLIAEFCRRVHTGRIPRSVKARS